jgi:hypothetical protein
MLAAVTAVSGDDVAHPRQPLRCDLHIVGKLDVVAELKTSPLVGVVRLGDLPLTNLALKYVA